MKFKLIFILFNLVIVFSFAMVFFMPLMLIGSGYSLEFWNSYWYLPLLFVALLAVLNTYFISNWKLLGYLESEDWDAIRTYILERFCSGRLKKSWVRILVTAALVTRAAEDISTVAQVVKEKKPSWYKDFVLLFGIPVLISKDPLLIEGYYGTYLELESKHRAWVHWSYAFALLLQKRFEEAKGVLQGIPDLSRDPLLLALTGYVMDAFGDSPESLDSDSSADAASAQQKKSASSIRDDLRSRFSPKQWQKQLEKAREDIHIAVLSGFSLVEDAGKWLYDSRET